LYFTVSSQDIFYVEEPSNSKFYVDFTYNTSNSKLFVSYLRSGLNWKTQYQLNLYNDKNDLIVMANIRNDGKSSISVDQAENFSSDINLRMQRQRYAYDDTTPTASSILPMSVRSSLSSKSSVPTIEQGNELAGVYVFSINKSFVINAKTNYLLPMLRPQVSIQRYGLISKIFSTMSSNDKAERTYRLKSDRYLSRGR
jgi:hypothetical protein